MQFCESWPPTHIEAPRKLPYPVALLSSRAYQSDDPRVKELVASADPNQQAAAAFWLYDDIDPEVREHFRRRYEEPLKGEIARLKAQLKVAERNNLDLAFELHAERDAHSKLRDRMAREAKKRKAARAKERRARYAAEKGAHDGK